MKKELRVEIDGAITELEELFSSFDQEEINLVPFEGSWTAGQLAKHMVMSNYGFIDMVNGPVKETDRSPDQMVEQIRATFLNFDTKMKSPDFVVPPKTSFDKEALLNSLKDIRSNAVKAIDTLELDKTCTSFELPGLGFLTRLEALNFVLFHTQRHIHQLKNISEKIEIADKTRLVHL